MKELERALADLYPRLRYTARRGVSLRERGAERFLGRGRVAVEALREFLYLRYFRRASPLRGSRSADRPRGEPAFVAELAHAARGANYWESGWRVVKAADGWAFLHNGQLTLFLQDRRLLHPVGAGEGEEVFLRLPCSRENLELGFFFLVGRAGPVNKSAPRTRLYLNLEPAFASRLVRQLLFGGAAEQLRFEARLVNDPAAYGRVDTARIDVEPEGREGLLALLSDFAADHPGWLRAGTPLFTREVTVGLGAGEVDGEGESFGERRCRLWAEAVLAALEADLPQGRWLSTVEQLFARQGVKLGE